MIDARWLGLPALAGLSVLLLGCPPERAGGGTDAGGYDAGSLDSGEVDAAALDVAALDVAGQDAVGQDGAPGADASMLDAGPVPGEWDCPQGYWGDGDCDCGCAALDVDCPDALASSCDFNFCAGAQEQPQETQNWLCTVSPDAGVSDATQADSAQPDSANPDSAQADSAQVDSAPIDAGPPPLQRDESCTELGADRCAPGLVCTPTGTCQELCTEEHCTDNASFCFSTSPDHVCAAGSYPHCVDGEGGLKLCRDIDLDFTEQFCESGGGGYVWYYHSQNSLPQGCWDGWIEFTTTHICISGVVSSQLTALAHDLTVITNDPTGYTDTSSCSYFSSVELTGLKVIGGDLEVGDVSGHTTQSELETTFSTLELPVLEAVYGQLRYDDAPYVTHINAPQLALVGGFFVLDKLPAMETVYLPGLEVIEGGLRIRDMPALTTLNMSNLRRIDGYVSISNVPCIDSAVVDAIAARATGPVSLSNVGTGTNCP